VRKGYGHKWESSKYIKYGSRCLRCGARMFWYQEATRFARGGFVKAGYTLWLPKGKRKAVEIAIDEIPSCKKESKT